MKKRADARTCKVITEAELESYDEIALLVDYMDIINQIGFVALFTCAYPMAPLLVLLYVFLQSRIDAFRLCAQYRRPHPFEAKDIGSWLFWVEMLGYFGIFSNSWIILSSSYLASPNIAFPSCLETDIFCFDDDAVAGGVDAFGSQMFFNGTKLMLLILLCLVGVSAKRLVVALLPADEYTDIVDRRFARISGEIFSDAERAKASNERPVRYEGSFDYSFDADYMKIRKLGQACIQRAVSKAHVFRKEPSHRLSVAKLNRDVTASNATKMIELVDQGK